jgi:hypothetical protein
MRRTLFALFALLLPCACSGSSAAPGPVGGDCQSLTDSQSAANCPAFNASRYLSDCMATLNQVTSACRPKFDALADCIVGQPFGCTDAGAINDTVPASCQSENDAWQACAYGDAGK